MDYLNYEGIDLVNYVLNSSNKNKILCDSNFKEYLLLNQNHYGFVWLVQSLDKEETSMLLDNVFLEKIIDSDLRVCDKYNAILTCENLSLVNPSHKVIDYIIDTDIIRSYISSLDIELSRVIFNYIMNYRIDKINILFSFKDEVQEKLLDLDVIEKLMSLENFDKMFLKLSSSAIKKLLTFDICKNIFKNLTPLKLIDITSKLKYTEIEEFFINDVTFILNISTIDDSNYYRNIINNLMVSNYELVSKIEDKRQLYVRNQFNSMDEKGIFNNYRLIVEEINQNGITSEMVESLPNDFFKYDELNEEFLKKVSNGKAFEMICDSYFKDYAQNVVYNIREIVNYNKIYNIIDKERIDFYNQILNFELLNIEKWKEIVDDIKDYSMLLYEDYNKCKNMSFDNYNQAFLKLDKSLPIYNKDLSNEKDIDIYYLDGQDFFSCVHVGNFDQNKTNSKTISLSFIGTENIGVFYDNDIIVGFDHLTPSNIMHVYNSDSYTIKERGTRRVNKIYDTYQILKETNYYNEILYKESGGSDLKASYVVCMDNIQDYSYKYAKENNLPIVVINTKKYKINKREEVIEEYQDSYEKRKR